MVWTPGETRLLRSLRTPDAIQQFLDENLDYNRELRGPSLRSPRLVMRDRTAQCLEGAMFAAAALSFHGHPPLLLDFEARRDWDHVVAIYKVRGAWGAIGKSNYSGLAGRAPVYRTLRELAMSYFEHYFNHRRERTLRRYSRPVNLERFDHLEWRTCEEPAWEIPEYLATAPHHSLLTTAQERRLTPVTRRVYTAGKVGLAG